MQLMLKVRDISNSSSDQWNRSGTKRDEILNTTIMKRFNCTRWPFALFQTVKHCISYAGERHFIITRFDNHNISNKIISDDKQVTQNRNFHLLQFWIHSKFFCSSCIWRTTVSLQLPKSDSTVIWGIKIHHHDNSEEISTGWN